MTLAHKGLAKKLAKFNVRYQRGGAHLNTFINAFKMFVYYGGFAYILQDWFGVTIPKEVAVIVVALYITLCYVLGYLDEFVGFWKHEAAYNTEELNPPMKKLIDQVSEIHKHLTNG